MGDGQCAVEGVDMNLGITPDCEFWAGRRVLLTGHTGFKGAWLLLWLSRLGSTVKALGLPPHTEPNLFTLAGLGGRCESLMCDIRDADRVATEVRAFKPEIVLHLAAQALVRPGYRDPLGTFGTNVLGTANVLDAVRGLDSVRVLVAITTDKVYRNIEHQFPFRETDALGGHDPYSASKAASEIVIGCYRDSYLAGQGVGLASARAGNVIGGGDWSEDRLIPDAVRAWSRGEKLHVRRPGAVRPWQHVLEPLAGYLRLARVLWSRPELADAYNLGPLTDEAATVREVIELGARAFGCGQVVWHAEETGPHEAGLLRLDVARARHVLGVEPRWPLQIAVARTMAWYRSVLDGGDALAMCEADFTAFSEAGGGGGLT